MQTTATSNKVEAWSQDGMRIDALLYEPVLDDRDKDFSRFVEAVATGKSG
jgi:hypothetical protein